MAKAKKTGRPSLRGKPNAAEAAGASSTQLLGQSLFKYWDLLFLLAYVTGLAAVYVPELKWDYDYVHHPGILMSSIRIWDGQVPYRDFFPWYGVLYHYLAALFVGLMGNDLYAVKIYLNLINPILCMALLIAALKSLELPAPSRIFVYGFTVLLGLERIYFCGSLRPFLPVALVALWYWGMQKRKNWVGLLIFPSSLFMFLFSPELGVLLFCTAVIFIGLAGFVLRKSDRSRALVWSLEGLVLTAAIFLALDRFTTWMPAYLERLKWSGINYNWSYGLSRPGMAELWKNPGEIYFYLPPIACALALGIVAWFWERERKARPVYVWVISLAAYGGALWLGRIARGGLQFNYLPVVILAGLAFVRPFKPARTRNMVAQALIVLLLAPGVKAFQPIKQTMDRTGKDKILGVFMQPKAGSAYQTIQAFSQAHPSATIGFPVNSLSYAVTGRIPDIPLNDPYARQQPAGNGKIDEVLQKKRAGIYRS